MIAPRVRKNGDTSRLSPTIFDPLKPRSCGCPALRGFCEGRVPRLPELEGFCFRRSAPPDLGSIVPALAKIARAGHPQCHNGKEEQALEGRATRRFLQGRVRCCRHNPCPPYLKPVAQSFVVPALSRVRKGRGTHGVFGASENRHKSPKIKGPGHPPSGIDVRGEIWGNLGTDGKYPNYSLPFWET